MKKIIVFIYLLLLAGCGFTPQTVNLSPELLISGDNVQGQNIIIVQAVDERPTNSLGRKLTEHGPGGEITTTQDVLNVVKNKLQEGFYRRGFKWPDGVSSEIPTTIIAEIRALDYAASMGLWTVGVHANGAIKIIAKKEGEIFKKMYRVKKEKRLAMTTEQENEKIINAALSELLSKIVNDKELFNFLTAK